MRYLKLIIPIIILSGCSKEVKLNVQLGTDEAFEQAMNMYKNRKYNKSTLLFQEFFNNYQGSKYADDAQYYLAMSYFNMYDYRDALNEFVFLLENFPESPFAEKGYFRKAECLEKISPNPSRDQKETIKAIDAYQEFITRHPYSEYVDSAKKGILRLKRKIALKDLNTARIYCKMKKYPAALIYIKKVINETEDVDILDKVYIMKGDILKSRGDVQGAKDAYLHINNEKIREKKLKGIK